MSITRAARRTLDVAARGRRARTDADVPHAPNTRPAARPYATHTREKMNPNEHTSTITGTNTNTASRQRPRKAARSQEGEARSSLVSFYIEVLQVANASVVEMIKKACRHLQESNSPRSTPCTPPARPVLAVYQFIVLSRRIGVPITGRRSRIVGLNGSSAAAPDAAALWSAKPRSESAA